MKHTQRLHFCYSTFKQLVNYLKKRIGCFSNCMMTFVLVLFCAIVLGSVYVFVHRFSRNEISDNLNDWSNYAICLTALFTFISLIFIYNTYKSQKENNEISRFNDIFFNMLKVQRGLFSDLEKDHFKKRISKIEKYYGGSQNWTEDLSEEDAFSKAENLYWCPLGSHDKRTETDYFRNLCYLIKKAYDYPFDAKKNNEYIALIQSQMSGNELFVMFYAVIVMHKEYPDNLPLLDKYGFFENLRPNGTLIEKIRKACFPKTKFKKNYTQEEIYYGF